MEETKSGTDYEQLKNILKKSITGNIIKFYAENLTYDNKEFITIYVNDNQGIFQQVNSKEIIKLDLNNLINNPYRILGINSHYTLKDTTDMSQTTEIISFDIDETKIEDIGSEILFRELGIYERDYSYNEFKESIMSSLKETIYTKNDIYTFSILDNKSEKLLDDMMNYQLTMSKKPIMNAFIDNNYDFLFKPIVKDIKKIYTSSPELLQLNELDDHTLKDIYFSDFNKEMDAVQDINYKYYGNQIEKEEYLNYITNEYDYTPEDQLETFTFKSITNPYLKHDNLTNISFYSTNNKYNQEIYRVCNPNQLCNGLDLSKSSDSMKKKIKISTRKPELPIYNLKDILSDRFISDRNSVGKTISTCNGSGKVPEIYYSDSKNKLEHKISDFNKTINEPPKKETIIDGEEMDVIGIMVQSIFSYKPGFTNNIHKEKDGSDENNGYTRMIYFPQVNNIGYHLVDQININKNNKHILNNIQLHDSITNIRMDTMDYTKNNFIYFNKNEKNEIDIETELSYISPTIIDIFNIEKEDILDCFNFNDIDKILNKYNISIYNSSIYDIKKLNIKKQLGLNIEKVKFYSNYNHELKEDSKNNYEIYKKISNHITKEIHHIDSILIENFHPENKMEYNDLMINNVIKRLSNLQDIYSLNVLENMVINFYKLNFNYSSKFMLDKEKYNELLYIIILNIFNQNKYLYFYYENSYLYNILNYKKILNHDEKLKMNILFSIYNIKIDLNVINDNKCIQFLQILKKTFDGGKLLYSFYDTILLEKNINKIENELLEYAKNNYLKQNMSIELWNNITYSNKLSYIPSVNDVEEELETIKKTFNDQKKKYNFYLKKCECFEIVKVYREINDIRKDNRKEHIFYSHEFDTSTQDYITAKTIFDHMNSIQENKGEIPITIHNELFINNLISKLQDIYILDSEYEIQNKINNIKRNWNNDIKQRKIVNGEYSILINSNSRILYKYRNDIWIALQEQNIIDENICQFEKELLTKIIDIDFDYLLNVPETTLDEELKQENTLKPLNSKCSTNNYENKKKCVPKHFFHFIYKLKKLSIFRDHLENVLTTKDEITISIGHKYRYIDNKIQLYENIKLKNKMTKPNIPIKQIENVLPTRLLVLFKNAVNIADPDLRLDSIKHVINNYGVLYKLDTNGNKVIDKNIYWDYPKIVKIMCCKHYLDLVKLAWMSNESRYKMLEQLKLYWCKNRNIHGDNIMCDHCGEPIDKIAFSNFEGFSGSDRPIQIREEVEEEYEERYVNFIGEHHNIQELLNQYINTLGIELLDKDTEFIVNNTYTMIKQKYINIEYYFRNIYKHKKKEKLIEMYNKYSVFITFSSNKLNEIIKNKKENKEKREFSKVVINIKSFYQIFIDCTRLSIMISYLYLILIYSTPPYKVKGSGFNRISGLSLQSFNPKYIQNNTIFLIKNITGIFITKNENNYIKWKLLNKIYQKLIGKENQLYDHYFLPIFNEIQQQPLLQKLKIDFSTYTENVEQNYNMVITQDNLWVEFRPLLKVNYNYEHRTNIEDLVTSYNNTLRQINENEDLDNEILKRLQKNLIRVKQDISNELKLISFKLISSINRDIYDNLREIYNIAYVSSCCINNINSHYIDYFIDKNPEEYEGLINTIKTNSDFVQNISNKKKNVIVFNQYNTNANHEKMEKQDLISRELLDYMSITKKIYIGDEYIKHLKNTIKQINNIVITDLFRDLYPDIFINKKRIWQEYYDQDIILIDDIYNSLDYKPTIDELKELLFDTLKELYSDFDDNYIHKKVNVIVNYDGYNKLDIVSGQYEYEVVEKVNEFIKEKTEIELIDIIDHLNKESNKKNILLDTNVYKIDTIKYNINELEIIQKIQDLFNQGLGLNIENYYDEIYENQTNFDTILGIHKTYFGENIDKKNVLFDKLLYLNNNLETSNKKLKKEDIENYFENIGNHINREQEAFVVLEERLIIEDYTFGTIEKERTFRKYLIKNKNNSKKIKDYHSISRLLLYILVSIKNNKKYGETFQSKYENMKIKTKKKNMVYTYNLDYWWLSKVHVKKNIICKCPADNHLLDDELFTEIYNETFQNIDSYIQELNGIPNFMENLNVEYLLKLLDLLNFHLEKIDCNNQIQHRILNSETIFILSEFLLYTLLYSIFIELDREDEYRKLHLVIFDFIFYKNIVPSNSLYFTNLEIMDIINDYNSTKNRRRKENIEKLSPEIRNSYKLYRKLNLGDIFDINNNIGDNEDELFMDSGNIVHENIQNQNIENMIGEEQMDTIIYNEELDEEAYMENMDNEDNNDGNYEFMDE